MFFVNIDPVKSRKSTPLRRHAQVDTNVLNEPSDRSKFISTSPSTSNSLQCQPITKILIGPFLSEYLPNHDIRCLLFIVDSCSCSDYQYHP
ncbi:hypothetical protein TNCV_2390751 [Trichonephila clavipes]|nr:hypothetical protein TNCV_2390751 [Trichonephila clavipes]